MAAGERRRQLVGSGTFPRLHPAPAVGPQAVFTFGPYGFVENVLPFSHLTAGLGLLYALAITWGLAALIVSALRKPWGLLPAGVVAWAALGHCRQPPGGTPAGPGHRPRAGARFVQSLHHQGPSGSARGPGCPGRVPAPGRDQRRPGDYGLVGCRRRRRAQYRRVPAVPEWPVDGGRPP